MSAWYGRHGKGAAAALRDTKRAEAEARNAATPTERRAYTRRPCPTGKRRYASEHDAQVELLGAVIGHNAGDGRRRERRHYECHLCGGWHLTSKAFAP